MIEFLFNCHDLLLALVREGFNEIFADHFSAISGDVVEREVHHVRDCVEYAERKPRKEFYDRIGDFSHYVSVAPTVPEQVK